ncbi:MAG: ELM1/GtrOC1 family putative glycosyltransferase [Reyranellaceae bacterium]
MGSQPASRPKSVWLLLDDRPGHRTQVVGLGRDLGWPVEEKPLRFNSLERLPRFLLGATLRTLEPESRRLLQPPFPDLVIGMGRRIVPAARWIRRQSGGRSRIVLIGRKVPNDSSIVDLTVACAHFGQIPHPALFELVVPPTQVDAPALAAAREARPDPMAGLAAPHVLLLVGGPTSQHLFDEADASAMASAVSAATSELGGALAIVTSRRTPAACVAAMRRAAPSAHLHEWQPGRVDNPYLSYLANADLIVATGESESMLAEAVAAARPLTIWPLRPKPPGRKARRLAWLASVARGRGPAATLARTLFARGWITPPRDLAILHAQLQSRRLARVFDGAINAEPPAQHDEKEALVARIVGLFGSVRS